MMRRAYDMLRLLRCPCTVLARRIAADMITGCLNDRPDGIYVDYHGLFFAACRNGNLPLLVGHIQFDHHLSSALVRLRTGDLQDDGAFGLYEYIYTVFSDSLLCFLVLRGSQDIDCSRSGGEESLFLIMNSRLGRCFLFHRSALTRERI